MTMNTKELLEKAQETFDEDGCIPADIAFDLMAQGFDLDDLADEFWAGLTPQEILERREVYGCV